MNTRQLVIDFLQSLSSQSTPALPIDEDARAILRNWMIEAKQARLNPSPQAAPIMQPVNQSANPASSPPAAQPAVGFMTTEQIAQELAEEKELLAADEEFFFRVPQAQDAQMRWSMFEQMLPHWEPLQKLGSLRSTLVLGQGSRHADIMFVGEAPGYQDELELRPFAGPAGQKLDEILKAMGLSRDEVYLTQLLKYRPATPQQTTNNRPPNEKEIQLSSLVLAAEIDLLRPRVIVALGVMAARGILQLGALPLSAYQSEPRFYEELTPVVVTQHPSYLLRTSDRAQRRALWEDMLRVMELAHLPISERQRGFFLPKNA